MDVIVNPPRTNEPSYEVFTTEKKNVLSDLAGKAKMVETFFNELPGFRCQPVLGAMYAFPTLDLPVKAQEAARVSFYDGFKRFFNVCRNDLSPPSNVQKPNIKSACSFLNLACIVVSLVRLAIKLCVCTA